MREYAADVKELFPPHRRVQQRAGLGSSTDAAMLEETVVWAANLRNSSRSPVFGPWASVAPPPQSSPQSSSQPRGQLTASSSASGTTTPQRGRKRAVSAHMGGVVPPEAPKVRNQRARSTAGGSRGRWFTGSSVDRWRQQQLLGGPGRHQVKSNDEVETCSDASTDTSSAADYGYVATAPTKGGRVVGGARKGAKSAATKTRKLAPPHETRRKLHAAIRDFNDKNEKDEEQQRLAATHEPHRLEQAAKNIPSNEEDLQRLEAARNATLHSSDRPSPGARTAGERLLRQADALWDKITKEDEIITEGGRKHEEGNDTRLASPPAIHTSLAVEGSKEKSRPPRWCKAIAPPLTRVELEELIQSSPAPVDHHEAKSSDRQHRDAEAALNYQLAKERQSKKAVLEHYATLQESLRTAIKHLEVKDAEINSLQKKLASANAANRHLQDSFGQWVEQAKVESDALRLRQQKLDGATDVSGSHRHLLITPPEASTTRHASGARSAVK